MDNDAISEHEFVPPDSVVLIKIKKYFPIASNLASCLCKLSLTFCLFCHRADDARQPMSRVVPIPSSQITPYRIVIILRLIILGFFLQYRATHPVKDAYALWIVSVICEIWFALSWLLDQFPKWYPVNRETYLDRLALRFATFVRSMWFYNEKERWCYLFNWDFPFAGMIVKGSHHN